MLSAFEALRAYAESRGIAVTGVKDIIRVAGVIAKRACKLHDLSRNDRRVVFLLWYLGLVTVHLRMESGRWSVWMSPTPLAYRVARGELAPLVVRIARWTPMRILLRYMASRGGGATVDDVERDLGGRMLEVTQLFLPVLKLAYPRFKNSARKPYNKHVVDAVLFRLGAELGLLSVERRGEAEMTELAYELLEEPRTEIVKTMPKVPLILLGVASVAASSRRVLLVSPWIDPEVAEALLPILKNRETTVVTRPPRTQKHREALKLLSQHCEVLTYPRLHTKLALGDPAIVTSANLTKTSLLMNLETGIYYREAPLPVRVHAEEIVASATRIP